MRTFCQRHKPDGALTRPQLFLERQACGKQFFLGDFEAVAAEAKRDFASIGQRIKGRQTRREQFLYARKIGCITGGDDAAQLYGAAKPGKSDIVSLNVKQ